MCFYPLGAHFLCVMSSDHQTLINQPETPGHPLTSSLVVMVMDIWLQHWGRLCVKITFLVPASQQGMFDSDIPTSVTCDMSQTVVCQRLCLDCEHVRACNRCFSQISPCFSADLVRIWTQLGCCGWVQWAWVFFMAQEMQDFILFDIVSMLDSLHRLLWDYVRNVCSM